MVSLYNKRIKDLEAQVEADRLRIEEYDATVAECENKIKRYSSREETAQRRSAYVAGVIEKVKKSNERVEKYEEEANRAKEVSDELTRKLKETRALLQESQEASASQKQKLAEWEQKINEYSSLIEKQKSQIAQQTVALGEKDIQIETLAGKASQHEKTLAENGAVIEKQQEQIRQQEQVVDELRGRLSEQRDALAQYRDEARDSVAQIARQGEETAALKSQIVELEAEKSRLASKYSDDITKKEFLCEQLRNDMLKQEQEFLNQIEDAKTTAEAAARATQEEKVKELQQQVIEKKEELIQQRTLIKALCKESEQQENTIQSFQEKEAAYAERIAAMADSLDRLKELTRLEREGMLIRTPFPVSSKVWFIDERTLPPKVASAIYIGEVTEDCIYGTHLCSLSSSPATNPGTMFIASVLYKSQDEARGALEANSRKREA